MVGPVGPVLCVSPPCLVPHGLSTIVVYLSSGFWTVSEGRYIWLLSPQPLVMYLCVTCRLCSAVPVMDQEPLAYHIHLFGFSRDFRVNFSGFCELREGAFCGTPIYCLPWACRSHVTFSI